MAYTISLKDDFNLHNMLGYIAQKSGHKDKMRALVEAINITETALDLQQKTGHGIRVWNAYSDGFSEFYRERGNFRTGAIWDKVLSHPEDHQAEMRETQVPRDTKRQTASIQDMMGFKNESSAVVFAVQMTYEMASTIDSCPGKAIVCITDDIRLRDGATQIVTPFEKTMKGKVTRLKNRIFG